MSNSNTLTRRQFSKKTAAIAAAVTAAPAINVLGANDKVQLGCIGLGGRGSHHCRQFAQMDGVKIVALSDAYMPHVERNAEPFDGPVQKSQDFRNVLDNKDVDAVVIASPDHWHAIQTVMACQAGKDVYVEKPMSRTVEEGQRMIQAAKYYKRVVQVGQQQRSSKQFQRAVEMVKNGDIGKVSSARCINQWPIFGYLSNGPQGLGHIPDEKPPEGLDYNLWLGPAPERPYNPNRFLMNHWYFFRDYSGGMLTGWGVHLFDIVMWAMGPQMKGAYAYGGKFVHDDDRDTPDTAEAIYDTPNYTFTYSLRHGNSFPGDPAEGQIDHGIYFYGDKATILVNRNHAKIYQESDLKKMEIIPAEGGDVEHKQNWLDCIHSRQATVCTPEDGFNANLPGLLALISCQVGRHINWDWDKQTIVGDDEAAALLTREYRKPFVLPEVPA